MKKLISLLLTVFVLTTAGFAQSPPTDLDATKPVQQAQSLSDTTQTTKSGRRELKIPAGTTLEIETAYTVISSNVADARIDIVAEGVLTDAQKKGWLLRLNDKINPF